MYYDPFIEEIHKIREEHAEKFNYDFDAIYLDLLKMKDDKKKKYYNFEKRKIYELKE
jgi:hypothetical protein